MFGWCARGERHKIEMQSKEGGQENSIGLWWGLPFVTPGLSDSGGLIRLLLIVIPVYCDSCFSFIEI